jgi:hypothetical protein
MHASTYGGQVALGWRYIDVDTVVHRWGGVTYGKCGCGRKGRWRGKRGCRVEEVKELEGVDLEDAPVSFLMW